MANQNLVDYINQSRQGGLTDDQIRQSLLSAGWGASDIDAAFGINFQPVSSPSQPLNIGLIPKGVKIISILGYIGSVISIISGLSFVVFSLLFSTLFQEIFAKIPLLAPLIQTLKAISLPIGLVFVAYGVLLFITSRNLKKGESWARIFFVILVVLGLASLIPNLAKTINAGNISVIVICLLILAYLLISKKVRAAFSKPLDVNDKKKLIIMTLILLLLVVTVIWFIPYLATNNLNSETKNSANQNISIITATSTPKALQLEGLSPKETYLKIKPESDKIKTYNEMEALVLKYGSKNQVIKIEQNHEKILALPQSVKDGIISLTINDATSLDKITNVQETIKDNAATLNITTIKPEVTGIVSMVLEDNVWKIDSESWKNTLLKK